MAVPQPEKAAAARQAPGPRGHWLFGSALDFQRDRLTFLTKLARDYGDVARLRFGPAHGYLVSHPDGIHHVLVENSRAYMKGQGLQKAKGLLGEGLLTSEGEFWRRQRRLAAPAFHPDRISALASTMTRLTGEMLDEWAAVGEGPLDIYREMMRLTLRIAGVTMFGTDVKEQAEKISAALTTTMEYSNRTTILPPIVEKLPLRMNQDAREAVFALDEVVYSIVRARLRSGEDRGDLLSMLVSARDEETGERMTEQEIRDEAITLLLAGHETTANALSFTWYLLSENPHAARRMREELAKTLGGRVPVYTDAARLPYTTMVLLEALRLYPPGWVIGRTAMEDDVIGGYRIEAGAGVLLAPWVTHRDSRFWDEPERFDPERFTPERMARRPRLAYFPFGAGPRNCIGQAFAMLEGVLVLAMVAQRYDLCLMKGATVALDPVFTLRPKPGVPMRLCSAG